MKNMKKILICLIVAIIASNCEISLNKAKAQDEKVVTEISPLQRYRKTEMVRVTVDGMELMVFFASSGYTSPHVINLTKEKLEIELLRKQLSEHK